MINRAVTRKDVMVYLLILIILIAGFGEMVLPIITKPIPEKARIIFFPIGVLNHFIAPKVAIIISSAIFAIYASKRFFDSIILQHLIIFGGLLILGYFYNVKLTDRMYLLPVVAVISIPQLINLLVYAIFKERGGN